ncbi:hypothetical protein BUALT_Bualt15G0007700 [Buddleja alternifolia]|uniref:Pre-mRNA-splicing factor SYF2 n=1 Tax=Buddleja alternifolia TaxID=168488 RepID=A0AAV6WC68_9LAMI|nr:hypothetical protein BUALT_Bualt15G0007700 [Buddleja alternifolia]
MFELKDKQEKSRSFISRRRKYHKEKNMDSINDRNKHFNKKIGLAFEKYGLEICQIKIMAEKRIVDPDCRNASNPHHECTDFCFKIIAEAKAKINQKDEGTKIADATHQKKKKKKKIADARKIDRNLLARAAQRREPEDPKGLAHSLGRPPSKGLFYAHSAEGSSQSRETSRLASEPARDEKVGSFTRSEDSDAALPRTGDVAPDDITSQSATKFCPKWNVKNGDSLFTREVAIEMMSSLIPPSDYFIINEATSEVLSYDGYDLLAKLLATHCGMVGKVTSGTLRVKELTALLEKETFQNVRTETELVKKTMELNRLANEISKLKKANRPIEEVCQKAEEANERADKAEKAKETMENMLLDYWLDGFSACRRGVVAIDPAFDIGRLVPSSSEFISFGKTNDAGVAYIDPAIK